MDLKIEIFISLNYSTHIVFNPVKFYNSHNLPLQHQKVLEEVIQD
jgi:hypothetical protein